MLLDSDQLRKIREAIEYDRLEEIRNDICRFAAYIMVDEKGKAWELGPHHVEWYRILWDQVKDIVEPDKGHVRPPLSKDNLLLMCAREHGKTSTMVCFLLYCLAKNPALRIKYVSGSEDLAIDVLGQVKKNIDRNERLHEAFPNLKRDPRGSWSGSTIEVSKVTADGEWNDADLGIKDASIQAYGISAPATGGRADLIVFDDIIRAREAIQEPNRLIKIAQVFYTDWLNVGGYRHIVIGTPWTPDDIHAQLKQNPDWHVWCKPALVPDEDGKEVPLWPERWPIEKLMARKRQIGEVAFDLQFMLRGVREKMEWWNAAMLEKCKDNTVKGAQIGQYHWACDIETLPGWFEIEGIVAGFDPAASLKQSGSYSCIFAVAYDALRRKIPIRIIRTRQHPRMLAEALVDMLLEIEGSLTEKKADGTVLKLRRVTSVRVETNATQQAFVDLINLVCENRGINLKVPIEPAFTGTGKWNPEVGLPRVVGEFEHGKWTIPWGDIRHQGKIDPLHTCNICYWIEEMLKYGDLEQGTTDMIMSSWLASSAIDANRIGDLPVVSSRRRMSVTNVNW